MQGNLGFTIGASTPETDGRIVLDVSGSDLHSASTGAEVQQPPPSTKIFIKKDVGEDIQAKVRELQDICYSKGMTKEQVHYTLALVDHESAGTWSETIRGDNGCSVGIGQWNSCAGRKAGKDFTSQAYQICDEMKAKFDMWKPLTAITKHNCPACMYRAVYVNRIKKSLTNFE